MTENEFNLVMCGEGHHRTFAGKRLRVVVAEEAFRVASALKRAGRPDRAGRMAYIASVLRVGRARNGTTYPSKTVCDKARKDVDELARRLIDGNSLSGL